MGTTRGSGKRLGRRLMAVGVIGIATAVVVGVSLAVHPPWRTLPFAWLMLVVSALVGVVSIFSSASNTWRFLTGEPTIWQDNGQTAEPAHGSMSRVEAPVYFKAIWESVLWEFHKSADLRREDDRVDGPLCGTCLLKMDTRWTPQDRYSRGPQAAGKGFHCLNGKAAALRMGEVSVRNHTLARHMYVLVALPWLHAGMRRTRRGAAFPHGGGWCRRDLGPRSLHAWWTVLHYRFIPSD
jgi:hypothetical protein